MKIDQNPFQIGFGRMFNLLCSNLLMSLAILNQFFCFFGLPSITNAPLGAVPGCLEAGLQPLSSSKNRKNTDSDTNCEFDLTF